MMIFFSIYVFLGIHAISVCSKKLTVSVGYNSISHHDIISSKSTLSIQAINIQPKIGSITFEVHSQMENLTMSLNKESSLHNSVSGTNIGLTSMLKDHISLAEMWIMNNSTKNVSVLIILVPHKTEDPIPGGCNMEFNVMISPFLKLSYNHVSTQLEYQQANIGYPRNAKPPSCDNATVYLNYDIYVYFLQENIFSEDEYFKGIEKMVNVSFIHQFATKVKPRNIHPTTRTIFYTYPNRGAIYNIISHYTGSSVLQEAAYVPIVTYGCKIISNLYGCGEFSGTFSKVIFIILAVFGIFVNFRGHQFLKIELIFFGFLAFSLIGFILIIKYSRLDLPIRDTLTVFAGLLGGTISLILLKCPGHRLMPMLLVGFVLGFLLTATILYTPLGDFEIFTYDQNYWTALCCGTILIPVILLPFPKTLNIVAASIVGSYTVVMAVDQFLGTTLSFIVINVIKRAFVSGLSIVFSEYPFQKNEIILSCVWALLSFLGIIIQFRASGRSHIPNCSCCNKKIIFCNIYRDNDSEINTHPYDLEHQNEQQPLISESQNKLSNTYETLPAVQPI